MKISVNDQELFKLSLTQRKVICHQIHDEIFEDDMKRRLHWVLMHKYDNCFERLKKEWEPKLKAKGVTMIPTDPDAFAELVFNQPEYKSRSQREAESKAQEQAVFSRQ